MKPKEPARDRLLSIDIIRIVGVTLILLQHMIGTNLLPSWIHNIAINYLPYLFYIDYGRIGVWLFVFASGCSLALNDTEFSNLSEVKNFYKKRLIRIYPPYWVSLLFSLLIFNWVIPSLTVTDAARWFSGFQMFFATTSIEFTKINITYWFIGSIVSLYFLYPLLFYVMKKHPSISLLSFFFVSLASRYIMFYVFPMFISGWDWFPACRIFNFALGIYLIQKGLFPKAISNRTIAFLGTMSFYVYLVGFPIMCATNYESIGIFFFLAGTIVFSFLLYLFDNTVKRLLLGRATTSVSEGKSVKLKQ
jgi:peptidoglycan/LPS O-acetylase OafA/YrhL